MPKMGSTCHKTIHLQERLRISTDGTGDQEFFLWGFGNQL